MNPALHPLSMSFRPTHRVRRAGSLRQALSARWVAWWSGLAAELDRSAALHAAPHLRQVAARYEHHHPALAAELRRLGATLGSSAIR